MAKGKTGQRHKNKIYFKDQDLDLYLQAFPVNHMSYGGAAAGEIFYAASRIDEKDLESRGVELFGHPPRVGGRGGLGEGSHRELPRILPARLHLPPDRHARAACDRPALSGGLGDDAFLLPACRRVVRTAHRAGRDPLRRQYAPGLLRAGRRSSRRSSTSGAGPLRRRGATTRCWWTCPDRAARHSGACTTATTSKCRWGQ